jgi:hypothetical protein
MTDDIADRLDRLESRLDSLSEMAVANDGDIEEIDRQLGGLRQDYDSRLDQLEQSVERLTQSIGFVEQAVAAEASDTEARAAICLETLVTEAQRNGGNAMMDADGVSKALDGEINRSSTYDILRKMNTVCEAVRFVKEDRNADRNTRVELRLDETDSVVSVVAGRRVELTRSEVSSS